MAPKTRIDHKACPHARTPEARAKCRKQLAAPPVPPLPKRTPTSLAAHVHEDVRPTFAPDPAGDLPVPPLSFEQIDMTPVPLPADAFTRPLSPSPDDRPEPKLEDYPGHFSTPKNKQRARFQYWGDVAEYQGLQVIRSCDPKSGAFITDIKNTQAGLAETIQLRLNKDATKVTCTVQTMSGRVTVPLAAVTERITRLSKVSS